MLKEFKEFALKGNVMDLAIGVIIGAAFSQIVTSLVSDVISPILSLLTGKINFENLYYDLSRTGYESLAAAKLAEAPVITYGAFINSVIQFLLVAWVLFLVIKQLNRFRPKAEPTTMECRYCLSEIPKAAARCKHCTSNVNT